jgi:hypothetical protein
MYVAILMTLAALAWIALPRLGGGQRVRRSLGAAGLVRADGHIGGAQAEP